LIRCKIAGIGAFVPEKILTNNDLEKMVETSDEWITARTGIKERHIISEGQTTSDISLEASKKAIAMAGITAQDIDLILVATLSGDMPMPSTASILQYKLGARYVPAMDLNAACCGFLYGLSVADSFIKADSQRYKNVLVVGADVMSAYLDWEDRSTCILFGDGAGAAVVSPSQTPNGILSVRMYCNGGLWDLIRLPGGGAAHPPSQKMLDKRLQYIKMKGNETFKIAVRSLSNIITETLEEHQLTIADLALLIPHQANLRIIQAIAERVGLPMEKVFINIEKYGNTSAASIPIALEEAVLSSRISEGDYIVMEAFGSGLTWASALIKW
jgi:3-oxoacyl-[acyl-carrier-protein] synthase-3